MPACPRNAIRNAVRISEPITVARDACRGSVKSDKFILICCGMVLGCGRGSTGRRGGGGVGKGGGGKGGVGGGGGNSESWLTTCACGGPCHHHRGRWFWRNQLAAQHHRQPEWCASESPGPPCSRARTPSHGMAAAPITHLTCLSLDAQIFQSCEHHVQKRFVVAAVSRVTCIILCHLRTCRSIHAKHC